MVRKFTRRDKTQIWTTTGFKKFLLRKKVENPDKTLMQIMDDMAKDDKRKNKKRFFDGFM